MSQGCDTEKNMCFVCLESCNNNFCDVCTCCAHPKCLKNYIDSQSSINVRCPVCKNELRRHKTRAVTQDLRWQTIIRYIKKMLWLIENEPDIPQRKFYSKKLLF